MKNILVIGCYHSLNSGVMAMAESIVQQFPEDSITILTSDQYFKEDQKRYSQYSNVSLYSVEWFDKSISNYIRIAFGLAGVSLYPKFSDLIKEIDLVIDISGDSISADYGTKSMFFSLFPAFLISQKAPLLYGPQTVGPFKTVLQRYLAKRAFRNSKGVFLREEVSQKYLSEININVKKSHADLAFLLKPNSNAVELPENTVGIGVSALIKKFGKKDSEQLFKSIIDICLERGYNVLLVTHVDTKNGSDVSFGERLKYEYYASSEEVLFFNKNFTASEWKYVIGQCQGIISARMHPVVQA
ncbi:MAG: polysaccharide pyruvyl transferase family protein, partial [Candidatus Paceibacterota bacterium]